MVQETIDRLDERDSYIVSRDGDTIVAEAAHGGRIEITVEDAEAILEETEGEIPEWGDGIAFEVLGGYARVQEHAEGLDVHFTTDDGQVRSNPFDGNHLVSIRSGDLSTLVGVEA